jgi:hypothetical protein
MLIVTMLPVRNQVNKRDLLRAVEVMTTPFGILTV